MSEIIIDLAPNQIKEAFEKLPITEQIKLVEEFERETRAARWDPLVRRIRKRVAKYPISQKEINRICEDVRKEQYGKNKRSN